MYMHYAHVGAISTYRLSNKEFQDTWTEVSTSWNDPRRYLRSLGILGYFNEEGEGVECIR